MIKNYIKIYDSINSDKITNNERDILKNKLRNLKFDNDYECCFTGKKIRDLYEQAFSRMECSTKYDDIFNPDTKL